jgi:hypothetical protein
MQTPSNPGLQIPIRTVPLGTYVHEAAHRAAAEIHGSRMRLRDGRSILVGSSANNKVLADNPTAHVPVHHERESAEHPLLF